MVAGEKEDPKHETEASLPFLADASLVRLSGLGHLGAFYRSDLALPHVRPFLRSNLREARLRSP
ncbi:MAG: hypothetical protein L3J93_02455 [Thermoplasmata archaeon]|nr:hypothetical protein [Thermoplasmata archaeon]